MYIFSVFTDLSDTPRSFKNRKQAKNPIPKHPIFITDKDNDYILDELMR